MSRFSCPDHPVIRNLEQTGHPDGIAPEYPRCPICGEESDTFYYSTREREIVGCECCVMAQEAWKFWGE